MAGVQLYKGLIKATEQIVARFGKDVLTEERFVNILHDLYPDRDNPAIFKIIKLMMNDGCFPGLLSCNKESIHNFVSKNALSFNQKNGYDKQMTEGILYSIAVGSGVLSLKDINSQTSTSPSQTKPTNQNSNNQQKKNRYKNSPNSPTSPFNKKSKKTPSSYNELYNLFYLAIAFIGLFIAPVIYLLAITGIWWPSITLFLILFLQAIIFSISYKKLLRNKPLPFIGGSFSAIIFCGFIFYALAPFCADSDSTKEVIYFLGIPYGHEMAFPLITLIISIFCYLGYVNIGGRIAGYDITPLFDKMTDNYPSSIGKTGIKTLLNNKKFLKGFLSSCLFIFFTGLFVMHLPTIDSWRIEINNMLIKIGRSSENKDLSFAGFRIGSDMDSCINVAKTHSEYDYGGIDSFKNMGKSNSIVINNYSFGSFDSTMCVKTKWYEDSVDFMLHSYKGKVIASAASSEKTHPQYFCI